MKKSFEKVTWSFYEVYRAVKKGTIYLDPPYQGCNELGLSTVKNCMKFWEIRMYPDLFFIQNSNPKWLTAHPEYEEKRICPYQPLDVVTDAFVRYVCVCEEKILKADEDYPVDMTPLEINRVEDGQIQGYYIPRSDFELDEEFYRLAVNHHRTCLDDFDAC